MKKTEIIQVSGLSAFLENIGRLAEHNPDYDLSVKELTDTGRIGERIFAQVYNPGDITLTEAPSSEEPDAPVRINVMADGEMIGTVLNRQVNSVLPLLRSRNPFEASLCMQGGAYKILLPDGEDSLCLQCEDAGMYAYLTLTYDDLSSEKEAEQAGSESSESPAYISTSYETSIIKEDPAKKGRFLLSVSLILAGSCLTFSCLYWYFIRSGKTLPLSLLGGDLPDRLVYPHLGMTAAGVILVILSLLTKNSIFPMLGGLCFALSGIFLPGYTIFTVFPAIFTAAAALSRKSENGFLTFLKVISLLAVIGGCGWFLKDTALHIYNNRSFAILPKWDSYNGEASAEPDLSGEDDIGGTGLSNGDFGIQGGIDGWDGAGEDWNGDGEGWDDEA